MSGQPTYPCVEDSLLTRERVCAPGSATRYPHPPIPPILEACFGCSAKVDKWQCVISIFQPNVHLPHKNLYVKGYCLPIHWVPIVPTAPNAIACPTVFIALPLLSVKSKSEL